MTGIGLLLVAWSFAAATPNPGAQAALQRAKILVQDGQYLGALGELADALKRDPENLDVRAELAGVSVLVYNQDRATRLDDQQRRAAVRAAWAALKTHAQRMQELKDQLETARLELSAAEATGAGLLGASETLARMSRTQIEDQILRQQMSVYIQELQKKLYEAVKSGRLTQPKDRFAALGFIAYYHGSDQEALNDWRKALAIDPSDSALKQQADWIERTVEQQQRKDTAQKLLELAQTLAQRGSYDQALAQLRAVSMLTPGDAELQKQTARLNEDLRKSEVAARIARARRIGSKAAPLSAVQAWLAVLDLDPVNAQAREAVGVIQRNLVAEAAAPRPRSPAAKQKGEAPKVQVQREPAQQHYVLGLTFYSQNELARAKKEMEEALALDPGLQAARTSLERIRSELGEP